MEVQDLGLVIPSIIPTDIVTTAMEVLKKKVLKCLWVRKVVDIGILIPANFPQVIVVAVRVLDVGLKRPATLPQVITEVVGIGKV